MNINKRVAVDEFSKSEAGKLLAEVFFRELQFISKETLLDKLVVHNHGMNSRVLSQDVLEVQIEDLPGTMKEQIILHLARNGIYHQLPEFLFHPISLSSPGMTNNEIVAAMRANRKKEEKTVKFFQPFDTAFFKDGVSIFKRSLNLFDSPYTNPCLTECIFLSLSKDNAFDTRREIQALFIPLSVRRIEGRFACIRECSLYGIVYARLLEIYVSLRQ